MSRINMEIIEYINSADFDKKFQGFFVDAILYELRNPDKVRFKDSYERMINERVIDSDME